MKYTRSLLSFSLFFLLFASVCGAVAPKIAKNKGSNRRPSSKPKAYKYFQEPGGDPTLGHYDNRYYHGLVAYDEHRVVLQHLIRSYLLTFRELGIETWIAHGTLLGWWWNGHIMPWDYDLDVQLSDVTLFYVARNYNRTIHTYRYIDDETGKQYEKEYLLDVNPNHSKPRGDGQNIIDARWIDTTNGMFIDITSLAERDPKRLPGVWSCKNYHRYRTRELYPLRETEFEGVKAMVPYSFDKVLTGEYGLKSLVTTEWEKHVWKPDLKEWVLKSGKKSNPQKTTPAPNPVTMTDRKGGDVQPPQDDAKADKDNDTKSDETAGRFIQSSKSE